MSDIRKHRELSKLLETLPLTCELCGIDPSILPTLKSEKQAQDVLKGVPQALVYPSAMLLMRTYKRIRKLRERRKPVATPTALEKKLAWKTRKHFARVAPQPWSDKKPKIHTRDEIRRMDGKRQRILPLVCDWYYRIEALGRVELRYSNRKCFICDAVYLRQHNQMSLYRATIWRDCSTLHWRTPYEGLIRQGFLAVQGSAAEFSLTEDMAIKKMEDRSLKKMFRQVGA